ncbi:MAG: hypothetical protein ACRDK2_01780, partial [Solirubrobacteraceae bacterium]
MSFTLGVFALMITASSSMATATSTKQGLSAEVAAQISWGSANGCRENIQTNDFGALTPNSSSQQIGPFDATPHALASVDSHAEHVWVGCVTVNTELGSVSASGLHDMKSASSTLPLSDVYIGLTNSTDQTLDNGQAGCTIQPGQQTLGSCPLPVGSGQQTLLSGADPGTTELDWQYQLDLSPNQPTGTYSGGEVIFTATAGGPATGQPPSNTTAPGISGKPMVNQTLIASTGSWTGSPTYTYRWERCEETNHSCSEITGATGSSYRLSTNDVGSTIFVSVTATNSAGSSSASSSHSGQIAAAPTMLPLPSACSVNATPEACVAAALLAGFPEENIAVDEFGDFFWGVSGPAAYSTGTNDEFNVYENGAPVEEGHLFRANSGSGPGLTIFVGVHNSTLDEIVAPSDQALSCDYTNKACYGNPTHYYGNPGPPAAPVNTAPPTISGTAEEGQTLSASTGSWTGSPTPTYTYQWQICDTSANNCSNLTNANKRELTVIHGDVGATLRVVLSATNTQGEASSVSAATGIVRADVPSDIAPPTITGIAQEGQTLVGNPGSWKGLAPLSYSYQWQDCDSAGEHCADILQATSTSLVPVASDVGHTIRLAVTVSNSVGSSTGQSAATAVILDSSPLNVRSPTITGSAAVGDVLTAAPGEWSGAQPITYSYQWQSCTSTGEDCAPIENATASTYTPTESEMGHALQVTVRATNAVGSTTASSVATLPVQGTVEGAACTETWTGGAKDGNWDTASNWITGRAPIASDHVCILTSEAVTVTNGNDQAGWVTDEGTLEIPAGGRLSINGPSSSSLRGLTLERGTLTGAGEVKVSTTFTAGNFGSLEGSGKLVLLASARGEVVGSNGEWLSLRETRTLQNEGQIIIGAASGITADRETQLVNSGTIIDNGEGRRENHGLIGPGQLINTGTIEKTEGEGASAISMSLDNKGSIDAQRGSMELTGGGVWSAGTPGTWEAAPNSELIFREGSYTLGDTATMSGSVTITDEGGAATVNVGHINGPTADLEVTGDGNSCCGGTLNLTGPASSVVRGLRISGARGGFGYINSGTINGPGELAVTSSFAGGELGFLENGLTLVIEPGASGIAAHKWITLDDATLINKGSFIVASDGGIVGEDKARILNSSTLTVNGENADSNEGLIAGPEAASLTNTGTLIKSEGTGISVVGFAIDNEGLVEAQSGELQFTQGGNSGQLVHETWSASSGAKIALTNFFSGSYALGESSTISGQMVIDSNVTAGAIEGPTADIVSELGDITLTGLTSSTLNSLTLEQPEPNYFNKQTVSIADELDIEGSLTWSSNDGWLEGAGSIVLGPSSTSVFDPSAWIQLHGQQFINEGTLTWKSGGVDASGDSGVFFINRGTFNADQDATNPVFSGCKREPDESYNCPILENSGTFTATYPNGHPHIGWDVSLANYGQLETPYEYEPECKWEYSESPGPGAEACYRAIEEFEGLLVEKGASIYQLAQCSGHEFEPCVEGHTEPNEEAGEDERALASEYGSPFASGEDCKLSKKENEHCYALAETPPIPSTSGFAGSSVEIDPTCMSTNGDSENFTDAEMWVAFGQNSSGQNDWTEAGATVGRSAGREYPYPEYFVADSRSQRGYEYREHDSGVRAP